MRDGDADKGDGAGEGRHAGGKHARKEDERRAEGLEGNAKVLRVHLAQLIGADGLREKENEHERRAADDGHGSDIFPAHAGKRAHRPVMKVYDVGVVCEGDKKIGRRRADVADHHAADDKHAHPLDLLRDGEHKAHGTHRAHKGRRNQNGRRRDKPARKKQNHDDRDAELRARGNAEHKGARDGVMEECLQKIAGDGQRAA